MVLRSGSIYVLWLKDTNHVTESRIICNGSMYLAKKYSIAKLTDSNLYKIKIFMDLWNESYDAPNHALIYILIPHE